MQIKGLQVEGGFLSGLNLEFAPDLNVLIGGRGVGKTAIIELIRFCMAAPNLDPDLAGDSHEHAVGVLQDGLATLVIEQDGQLQSLVRSSSDRLPSALTGALPLILSQREVETLARTPKGRLNLIDSFVSSPVEVSRVIQAQIKSLSVEIRDLCGEISELEEQLEQRELVRKQLKELVATQASLGAQSDEKRIRLLEVERVQREVNSLTAMDHALSLAADRIKRWRESLPVGSLESRIDIGPWPTPQDQLESIRKGLADDARELRQLAARADGYVDVVLLQKKDIEALRVPKEEVLRKQRQWLEEEQAGAGRVAREISRLEEALARLDTLARSLADKQAAVKHSHAKRMELLERLSNEREEIFERRASVAATLNKALRPRVKVDVKHSAVVDDYERAILDCLKGSSLRYGEIAPVIAREISPSELCERLTNWHADRLLVSKTLRKIVADVCGEGSLDQVLAKADDGLSSLLGSEVDSATSVQHGDLHGANVLCKADGSDICLIDFGDVGRGNSLLDVVTLELSPFFHPACAARPEIQGLKACADTWFDEASFPQGELGASWVIEIRKWSRRVAVSHVDLAAATLAYCARQLKYPDTDHDFANKIIRAAMREIRNV